MSAMILIQGFDGPGKDRSATCSYTGQEAHVFEFLEAFDVALPPRIEGLVELGMFGLETGSRFDEGLDVLL